MKETRHRIVILSDFIYVKLYGKRPALICDRKQGGKVTDCKEVWVTTLTNGNGSVFDYSVVMWVYLLKLTKLDT